MGVLFNDIEFAVLGSHIKIPMIFLVPVMFLVSLYVIVYFFANSTLALQHTEAFLSEELGGKIDVGELVVQPSLTRVHLYHASLDDPDGEKVFDVEQIHASLNPTMLIKQHIDVDSINVVNADVIMRIGEDGQLNLLRSLGIEFEDENDPPSPEEPSTIPHIRLGGLSIERSRYTFILDDVFEFTIPRLDLVEGEINLGPDTLVMHVPHLLVPRADFRYYNELFEFPDSYGDWTFSIHDFDVKQWRWVNDGYTVESVKANVEGYEIALNGRMGFPSGEEGMTYKAHAELSIPMWSPFIQYFVEENIHFDVPSLSADVEGNLLWIEGKASVYASLVEASGVVATDVMAKVGLLNSRVMVEEAQASFYGGSIDVHQAYFDLLQTSYGVEATFEGVNPAHVMTDLEVDLPWLSGSMSGGIRGIGQLPSDGEFRPARPDALIGHATDRWIDLELTQDAVLVRDNTLLVPERTIRVAKGSTLWVDLDRVVVPQGTLRMGPDVVLVQDLSLDYNTMTFETLFGDKGMTVQARLADLGPYASHYDIEGLVSGPTTLTLSLMGDLMAPNVSFDAQAQSVSYRGRVGASTTRLKGRLVDGTLYAEDVVLDTGLGKASIDGRIKLFDKAPSPDVVDSSVYVPARRMDTQGHLTLKDMNFALLRPFLPRGFDLKGILNAKADVSGPIGDMLACVDMNVRETRVSQESIKTGRLRASLRDAGVRRSCFEYPEMQTPASSREVEVHELDVDLGRAGRVQARGKVNEKAEYTFALKASDLDAQAFNIVEQLPVDIQARGDVRLRGEGSLKEPDVSGSVTLKGVEVAGLSIGDVPLVLNTTSVAQVDPFTGQAEQERTIHLVGATLPWLTMALEVPLTGESPIYARVGFDDLDVVEMAKQSKALNAFAQLRPLEQLRQLRLTGSVELLFNHLNPYTDFSVIATLPKLVIGPQRTALSNERTISVGYVRQDGPDGPLTERVTIEHFSLGAKDKYLTVTGSVTPEDSFVDLEVDGKVDLGLTHTLLSLVPDLMPEEIVGLKGSVDVDARLSGEPTSLAADGLVAFGRSTVQLRSLSDPLSLRGGRVTFERDSVTILEKDAIRGDVLGGNFNVWGKMGINQFKPSFAKLNVWSHNMSYSVPEVASVTFDTNLSFDATDVLDIKTWKIGGQVEFLDGLFYQDISVFEKELTGRVFGAFNRRTEVFEASVFDTLPELKQIGLNVTVKARDGFKLRNSIERFDLDMEFRFQLLLYNTLSDLRLAGDIEVVDGAIIFQGKRFNVRTGLVRFKGEPDNPTIDVVAGADIRNICKESVEAQELTPPIALVTNTNDDTQDIYHISLNVRGELDKLDLLYESIPYVDQRDVISLILTGCTVDLLTASSASQPTLETILGPLIGRLEREIQDVVKVEEFSIVPGVERTQVLISDSLTRRLSWRLQLDTQYNDASGQYAQLEYKLTDRLALQLSEGTTTDQNQANANTRLTIDLKLKYRIDLD